MYWEIIKLSWRKYLIDLVIAIVLINWDLKIFLVFALLAIVFKIDMTMNYLRKLIRVFQISNETKIIAIIRKLKITDKELADVLEETKGNTTKEDWVSAEKDFNDLGSTLNVGRQPLSSKEVADLLIPPYKNRSPASYKSNYRK